MRPSCPGPFLHVPTSPAGHQSGSPLLPRVSKLSGGHQPPRSPPCNLAHLPSFCEEPVAPGVSASPGLHVDWGSNPPCWQHRGTHLLSPLRTGRASSRTRSGPACFQLFIRAERSRSSESSPRGPPLLQTRKLEHREVKQLTQGFTAPGLQVSALSQKEVQAAKFHSKMSNKFSLDVDFDSISKEIHVCCGKWRKVEKEGASVIPPPEVATANVLSY